MSDRLTRVLLDAGGRPSRAARRWLAVTVIAAFTVAFMVTTASYNRDAEPPAHRGPAVSEVPADDGARASAGLRRVAPLPGLRRDPRPRSTSVLERTSAPPAPAALEPTVTTPPAPTTTPPAPTTAPPAPTAAPAPSVPRPAAPRPAAPTPGAAPESDRPAPSFESSGDFDSSG